jgi:type I restriction enzyme S subunit
VKDFHGNGPSFAYYFLQTMGFERLDAGASNPTLNRNHIHTILVRWPPLPTQRKLAAILTAYDDLIENNLRRIKILEEMAQNLYREWFVKFRFPGHEKTRMIDSPLEKFPEGWEVVTVEEIVKRIPSGKKYDQKTASPSGTVPILDQGRSGIIGYHDDEPGVMASEGEPIIVFANHTCYQRIIQFPFSAIQNMLPFLPNPERFRDIYWLHWATKDLVEFNDYKGHWPEFMSKELVFPKTEVCSTFGDIAKPIVQNCHRLEEKNTNLHQTRDLLLPKLISGELDVSDLDIKTGGHMQ